MTDNDLAELRQLCLVESTEACDKYDVSNWDIADVYRDIRRFHELVPVLLSERDALKVTVSLLSARLDDLTRRSARIGQ